MYFLDELVPLRMYKKPFYLPLNMQHKLTGSYAILMTTDQSSSKRYMTHPLMTAKYYNGYYIERAVMYYINHENSTIESDEYADYISEDVKLYDTKDYGTALIVSGYEYDIEAVKKAIKAKDFADAAKKYKIKLPKEINIEIQRNNVTMDFDNNTIMMASQFNFNKSVFKTYRNYCLFCMYCYIAKLCNPIIDEKLMAGNALYESGMYSMYKSSSKWPFANTLRVICVGIEDYKKNHSEVSYIDKVIKGHGGLFKLKAPTNMVAQDIMTSFLKTTADLLEDAPVIDIDGAIQLSEDVVLLFEIADQSPYIKKILYGDRLKSTKELTSIYKNVKEEFSFIKYTYITLDMYKSKNLFFDLSGYNFSFVRNNTYTNKRGYDLYMELMRRMINDNRFTEAGYNKGTVIIPIIEWDTASNHPVKLWDFMKSINPISCIYHAVYTEDPTIKEIFTDKRLLFMGEQSYFTCTIDDLTKDKLPIFIRDIKHIMMNLEVPDDNEPKDSEKAIVTNIVDKVETSQNVKIDNLEVSENIKSPNNAPKSTSVENKNGEGKPGDTNAAKKELVKAVTKAAKGKTNVDDTLNALELDQEERIKKALSDLATSPDNGSDISAARASRLIKLEDDFIDSDFKGKSVKEILQSNSDDTKIEPKKVNIDSVNEEWKDLKYAASVDSYDFDADIVKIFRSFINKSKPLAVTNLDVQDTSTSEDSIVTYTCKYEDYRGKRYTITVDIPKILDGKYMKLRGNRKTIQPMLFLMPIMKTEEDTVQIVSCYNKIYISRFGTTSGKSNVVTDKLIKALTRNEYSNIKILEGDNSRVCSKYELPVDYIDLASVFSKIETPSDTYFFNQDEIRKKYKVNDSKGLPIGVNKKSKEIIYYPGSARFFSEWLLYYIAGSDIKQDTKLLLDNYKNATTSVRYTYSRASILNSKMPLVLMCAYSVGLEETMRRAKIKYNIYSDKRPTSDPSMDIIKFKDGWLEYELTYSSSMLMNGLKACPVESCSIADINKKTTYVEFLDLFGGRVKADGLDNFYDCMIDPITEETMKHYKLPTNYIDALLYANALLSDNKYTKHGDIRKTRRVRRIEQIADFLYKEMTSAYGAYSTGIKHGRDIGFSVKRTAVIDAFLANNTTSDQSILNAIGEYEDYNAVTPRGSSGMNSERAYSLDKRSFDESMMNVLSTSTGFAGTVGITRQATIDANIEGPRGYIHNDPDTSKSELNPVKGLCMTEALTPFGTTRDDPMRTAMNYVQTSKHTMRTTKSDPLLITNGADEALPYLISNTFAYKAKKNGKVLKLTDDYMVLEYKDGSKDIVNLSSVIHKNSSSGFYVDIKLDTDLKEGKTFKADDIVAYDKESFTTGVGTTNDIALEIGPMIKFAIMNTDEGYEDSAIVSEQLSEDMASDVIILSHGSGYVISKDCDIFNMVKKGQKINEGDTLFIMQNAYDDEDANALLRALKDDNDVLEAGRVQFKSKYTGEIQDIIIKRTVELDELSPTLKKLVSSYENDIKRKQRELDSLGIKDDSFNLPTIGVLPATGKLKNAQESIYIEIYIKYHDKFSIGDKMIYGAAVKGVAKNIFPEGLEPVSDYRPNEKLDALLSIGSLNARMVTSVQTRGLINKGIIELTRQCKETLGIPTDLNELNKK